MPFGGQALGMLGGFGGKKKTIAAGLRVISPATGQTVVSGSGEQSKTQISLGGFGPGGMVASNPWGEAAKAQMASMGYGDPYASGYSSSKDGQMLTSAFIVAFNNVVAQRAALTAVKPARSRRAGRCRDQRVHQARLHHGGRYQALRPGRARAKRSAPCAPAPPSPPAARGQGLFVEVSDAYGTKGWISVEDLK